MVAQVKGVVVSGVAGLVIRVEVEVAQGLPSVGVIGLADAAVGESKWRVRSAIGNAGCKWPAARVTIGLSPADIPKHGTSLDLPIAVGVLLATEQIPKDCARDATFIGELGLDGALRPFRAALPAAIAAKRCGISRVYVAPGSARQVAVVPGVEVVVIRDLEHLVSVLRGESLADAIPEADAIGAMTSTVDMCDIRGHAHGRFALEVAAAGSHHLSLLGPPGVGKTMLAERLPTILPDLDEQTAIDVTSIHAVAGRLPLAAGLVRRPPFEAPHHSASATALLGTVRGRHTIPGALTLAHGGVLFLDEAPEFSRPCLEGLRQPMESGIVRIMRAAESVDLPAQFQLVLAANPCPCGFAVGKGASCRCTAMAKRRYGERLSGPLRDRIDIRLEVLRPTMGELAAQVGDSSVQIAERVSRARTRAAVRFREMPWSVNSHLPAGELRRKWAPDASGCALLIEAERGGLSLRGADRVMRVAWTLADLCEVDVPSRDHIAMALGLRGADRGPTDD
ncbi:MAG: ATP-binding protein [Candidatus Nanopelagicales bacterium]|nr:ATP-binding protein [Candidatus Nanopelagicales bacterium]